MALWLVNLNGRGLKSKSRRARLVRNLQRLGVLVCCLLETHLILSDYEDILSNGFHLYLPYFDNRSKGVSWLINRSLTALCADPDDSLCDLDVTIKGFIKGLCAQCSGRMGGLLRPVE